MGQWCDPAADTGRRAWVNCLRCTDGAGCRTCADRRTCDDHWRYLLGTERRRLFLQCPACRHRWWHDTEFGHDDRPDHLSLSTPRFDPFRRNLLRGRPILDR